MFKRIVLLSAITVHALSWSGMETRRLDACKAISFLSNLTSLFQPKAFNVSASASNFNKVLSKSTRVYTQLGRATPTTTVKIGGYVIGEFAQGGVVIWVTDDKQHGLVASIVNLGLTTGNFPYVLNWGPKDVDTGAINNQPLPQVYTNPTPAKNYGGYQNQQKIEALPNWKNDYPAFAAAFDYSIIVDNVYFDWFLPTLTELQQIHKQRDIVSKVSTAVGGDPLFVNQSDPARTGYWSSLEHDSKNAWCEYFSSDDQGNYIDKNLPFAVRCVRAF